MELSLQEKFAPNNACFGCGPANKSGLHLRSFPAENSPSLSSSPSSSLSTETIATWTPKPEYEAFPGILNGGIIGALLDCHSNWNAAWHLMQKNQQPTPPCTVTADYAIKLLRPTPTDQLIKLIAHTVESTHDRATVEAKLLSSDGTLCATCRGTFVAVKPGHPAYHRW